MLFLIHRIQIDAREELQADFGDMIHRYPWIGQEDINAIKVLHDCVHPLIVGDGRLKVDADSAFDEFVTNMLEWLRHWVLPNVRSNKPQRRTRAFYEAYQQWVVLRLEQLN